MLRHEYPLKLVLDKLELPKSTYYRDAGGRNPRINRWQTCAPWCMKYSPALPTAWGIARSPWHSEPKGDWL